MGDFAAISGESIAIIIAALAIGSFAKGMTGLGLPLISIPVIAGFLGVERAVVIMVLPGMASNIWLMWSHRSFASATRDLPGLLVAAVMGAIVGTWLLSVLEERILVLFLAAWIGVYLFTLISKAQIALSAGLSRRLSPVIGLIAGTIQGATGISSPIVASYTHALRLEKRAYIFYVAAIFLVLGISQLVAMTGLGLLTPSRLIEGLIAVIPIVIIMPLSIRISHRLSERLFDRILIGFLIVMEAKLLYNAFA